MLSMDEDLVMSSLEVLLEGRCMMQQSMDCCQKERTNLAVPICWYGVVMMPVRPYHKLPDRPLGYRGHFTLDHTV